MNVKNNSVKDFVGGRKMHVCHVCSQKREGGKL